MEKIDHSIKSDPEVGNIYTLHFDNLDGYGANAQVEIKKPYYHSSTVVVFRQSRYDTGKRILRGDIAKVRIQHKNSEYIKRYLGRNKLFYLIVYFDVIEIIVTNEKIKELGKEFDNLYDEFFRPLRRKLKIINAYVDYRPVGFSKSLLREDFILGNIDKLDLEITFRKELIQIGK